MTWHAGPAGHGDHGGKTTRTAFNRADQKAAGEDARQEAAGQKAAGQIASQAARKRAAVSGPGMVEAALAAFAHEVRTPLTGILAISNLLATSDLDERERRWADTIKAGAEHLSSLATLFVDAARSRGAHAGVRQDLFDLRALARSAGDSLAGRAAAKGLQWSVEISDKLPAFVVGDPVRLRAALENLIDNAAKFTEQGEITLTAVAAAGCRAKGRARSASPSRSRTAASVSRSTRSSGCSGRSRRPMSALLRGLAAPGSGWRRSSRSRARWAATSWWRRGAAAERRSRLR